MTNMTSLLERSAWLAWALIVLSMIGAAWMIADTDPPFRMLSYESTPARPGGILRVDAVVQRALSRRCSVTFSRHLFDSEGTRIDISPAVVMTADALEGLDRAAPGQLRLAISIPAHTLPGPARLVTPLQYQCNAWHAIRPIETTIVMVVEISP